MMLGSQQEDILYEELHDEIDKRKNAMPARYELKSGKGRNDKMQNKVNNGMFQMKSTNDNKSGAKTEGHSR